MSCNIWCEENMDTRCCFECKDYKRCQYKCNNILDGNLNENNYTKCSAYIDDEEKQSDCETLKEETVSKDFQKVIYLVKIKDKYAQELHNTKIANGFYGTIVNQTASNLYFELKDTKEPVIIPHEYILLLAPAKDK